MPGRCTFDGAYQPPVYGKYMVRLNSSCFDICNVTVNNKGFDICCLSIHDSRLLGIFDISNQYPCTM